MHIEHFIGSNPLLASTSCTDPVNNLKNLPKQTRIETPLIVFNLTDTYQDQTPIRSRSPSPFWVEDVTSSYSEVVKTGCIKSRNNSRSPTPIQVSEHISRNSNRNLLETLTERARSKSPKDKSKQDIFEKNTITPISLDSIIDKKTLKKYTQGYKDNFDTNNSKPAKRRSRSRRRKDNGKNVNKDLIEITTSENVLENQNVIKMQSIKPEIIVSDIKNQHNSYEIITHNMQSQIPITETCTQTDDLVDDSHAIFDQKLLTSKNTELLNTVGNFSKSRLSLTSVSDIRYSNSCFDLNERLKGIFGSVDKKHYKHNVYDRPRSKSDTRDLNSLTQIFTNPNTNDKYSCRFERSAESVKNNSNRETSGRRSFDNILPPFGNTQMERSHETDNKQDKFVRQSIELDVLNLRVIFKIIIFFT